MLARALSLDKAAAKRIWRDMGLPTAPFQVFHRGDDSLDRRLAFPLFVKPVRGGKGMGINGRSVVHNQAELWDQVRTDLINEILYLAADRYAQESRGMERQASRGNGRVQAFQDSALHAWATVPVGEE